MEVTGKTRLWLLGGLTCLVLAGAYFLPGWSRQWRADWTVRTVKASLARNDTRSAALGIQRALDLMPEHVEALRLKGNLLNQLNDVEAIEIWTRVAQLSGGRTNWCIPLALSVRMGRPDLGRHAAAQVAQNYSDDSDALRLLVAYHLLLDELPTARVLLEKLGKLDQTNVWDQFNRATLTLADKESPRKEWAEQELSRLAADPEVASPAYRILIDRNLARKDYANAAKFSEKLIQAPASLWSDRFNHIHHLWLVSPEQGMASLNAVLDLKPTDEQLLQLARRLVQWGYFPAAQKTIQRIDESRPQTPRVLALEAEMLARQGRWQDVINSLNRPENSRDDAVLEVHRVRANRELGRTRLANETLEYARTLSRLKPELQTQLADLLIAWGLPEDGAMILMQQALESRNPLPAVKRLARYYYDTGGTTNLGIVLDRWLMLEPSSLNVKNNYASIHLLLGENLKRAHSLASEIVTAAPTNQIFRSTYLLSLLKQGALEEIARELPKMSNAPPATALYQALGQAACGATNGVPALLTTARAEKLLPEERKLLRDLSARFQ